MEKEVTCKKCGRLNRGFFCFECYKKKPGATYYEGIELKLKKNRDRECDTCNKIIKILN